MVRSQKLAAAIAVVAVGFTLLAIQSVAFAAGAGYAPTTPPATPTGVSGTVVSTCTVQPSGGPCTATVDGLAISVTIPPGDFTIPTQILFSTGVTPTGVSGTVVGAFGLSVVQNGSKLTGTFSPAATLHVTDSAIGVGDSLYVDTNTGFTPTATATTAGSITSTFDSDPNYAVVAPVSVTAVPSATTPVTGKPFLLEELVAGLLVSVGAFGLILLRLKRRVHSNL